MMPVCNHSLSAISHPPFAVRYRLSAVRALALAALLLALLLATVLRFYRLGAQSLWNDEGTSVAMAQRDVATIARDAAQDIHPPLYYWLLSGWVRLLGSGEVAVRSLSALMGITLVALTYVLGRAVGSRWTALAAALLAAINPFQVYYSQEARMYMLLAAISAGAMVALLRYVHNAAWLPLIVLAVLEAAGLYTHYSFVFVAVVLNLALVISLRRATLRRLLPWAVAQGCVVLLYLPWLPIAVRQVRTWPSLAQATGFLTALSNAWRWLVLGPTIKSGPASVPLLLAAVATILGGVWLCRSETGGACRPGPRKWWTAASLWLWLGLPLVLMLALRLYREAYLKFLLVTSPAVCILMASGLTGAWTRGQGLALPVMRAANRSASGHLYLLRSVQAASAGLIVTAAAFSLHNYYTNPAFARDDYRGMAAYVQAVGRARDSILLNAPGQQEVFGYYYHGELPIFPLPEGRPLDPAATEQALRQAARPGGRIFAVLWATDESDPGRFIEGWLDGHAYKALDSWYGNVRLTLYSVPEQMPSAPEYTLHIPLSDEESEDQIVLLGYSLLNPRLEAGDIAQTSLFWQVDRTPSRRYKVFVHVLDAANDVVGQRDSEPGGGARLTTLWSPGEVVADHYGVQIHPATPPGSYRIEVGLYDADTGQRLTAPDGAPQIWLEELVVERPAAPAPVSALGMQHASNADFGELRLLGYDAYRLGFAHEPDALLHPGDLLHVGLYWQAARAPTGDWQVQIALDGRMGQTAVQLSTEPVVGFPTRLWQAGDVWRGQFDLILPAHTAPGLYQLRVQPIDPDGLQQKPFLSAPVRVEG